MNISFGKKDSSFVVLRCVLHLQDPQLVRNGGTVPQAFTDQRTEAGWTQRYLLVLLYYWIW